MCSGSACYGSPSCVNQAAIDAGSGNWGCSKTMCYSNCGSTACANMCYTGCAGLATSCFLYFTHIVICILNL